MLHDVSSNRCVEACAKGGWTHPWSSCLRAELERALTKAMRAAWRSYTRRVKGDDAIVFAQGHRGVVVVTADRELVGRVRAVDGEVRGPRWLLDQPEPRTANRQGAGISSLGLPEDIRAPPPSAIGARTAA